MKKSKESTLTLFKWLFVLLLFIGSIIQFYFNKNFFLTLLVIIILLFSIFYKKTLTIKLNLMKILLICVLIYMALPTFLFVISLPINILLRAITGIIIILFLIKAVSYVLRSNLFKEQDEYNLRIDFLLLFLGILVLSYYSILAGGGFVWDWGQHRTKLVSLYSNPLNPTIDYIESLGVSNSARFTYYYASFLPSAYVTKFITWFYPLPDAITLAKVLAFFFFLWSFLGMFLVLLLLPVACYKIFKIKNKVISWPFYLTLLVFSGLNFWLKYFKLVDSYFTWYSHAEWYAPYYAQISSFITVWQWAPMHLIAASLGVIVLILYKEKIGKFPLALWSAFLITSSMFSWIGCLPILLYFIFDWLLKNRKINFMKKITEFFRIIKTEFIATIFLTFLVLLFYLTRLNSVILRVNPDFATKGVLNYLFFLIVELLPIVIILFLVLYKKWKIPLIIWFLLGFTILLPIFEIGIELVMRGVFPAFFILMMYCAYVVQKMIIDKSIIVKILITIFFIILIPCFVNEFITSLLNNADILVTEGNLLKEYVGTGDIGIIIKKTLAVIKNKLFIL